MTTMATQCFTPDDLLRQAENNSIISENQRGAEIAMLQWAAQRIKELEDERESIRLLCARLAARTRADYDSAIENLLRAFGDAPVEQIREIDVGRYMDLRSSIHGANREKAVLSKILQLGIRWGWCTDNVAQKINYHPTQARRRIITRLEWQAIWLAGLDPLPVFMDLAFITGLRVSDVLALRWKQVRPEGLHVLQAKNGVEGLYELTDDLQGVLERAKRLHMRSDSVSPLLKPDTAIIHTKRFQPYKYAGIRSSWVRACRRAGVEGVRIHDIRRTAITTAKLAGYLHIYTHIFIALYLTNRSNE